MNQLKWINRLESKQTNGAGIPIFKIRKEERGYSLFYTPAWKFYGEKIAVFKTQKKAKLVAEIILSDNPVTVEMFQRDIKIHEDFIARCNSKPKKHVWYKNK